VCVFVQALFGILPNYLGYDDAKRQIQNDWTWSVGNTPHSITSSGTHFSAYHIDQVRRQQTIVMIEHVLNIFNSGVRRFFFFFFFPLFFFPFLLFLLFSFSCFVVLTYL
jgi:hypothetical protein